MIDDARFEHLTDRQRERFAAMLANSPAVPCAGRGSAGFDTQAAAPRISDTTCKHRGEPDGSCVEKLCCGFRRKTKTPAYRCELLNTRCVERIVAYEPNVVTCATCTDREPGGD